MKPALGLVVGVLGVGLGAVFVAQGCGGSSPAACTVGSESCACTKGGACDTGLSCLSNRCVKTGGGTDGGGGGSSGGGTSGGGSGGGVGVDGGSAGGSGGTGASAEAACDTFTALCAKYNECAPYFVQLTYGTVAECNKRVVISCKDAVKAPDSGLTAAAISTCGTAFAAATCEDAIYRKVTACTIKGGRSNGMACGTNEQCATGHCSQNDQACGVCADLVAAGGACMAADDCEAGLICSNDGHCVVPAAAGSICNDNQPCKYGLYCRNGSCVTGAATAGATCEPTLLTSCNVLKGIYCDSAVGKCANIGVAAAGDPCGQVGSKFVDCSKGSCVLPTADATAGICASFADDGATCDATTLCEQPARCIGGRCKLPSSSACL